MKLNKKIITIVAASTLFATAASAYGGMSHHGSHHNCGMGHGYNASHAVIGILPFLKQINLTDEQIEKIDQILKDVQDEKPSKFSAFKKDKFDKDEYVKQKQNHKVDMLKKQAEVIEEVYNVLNSKQKEQLRVLMDLQEGRINRN